MPSSLEEALTIKAQQPGAIPMAGGTDLMVHWPEHIERRDATYLDLSKVAELRNHRWTDDGQLELAAMTTYWDVLCDKEIGRRFPLLHEAARQVGAVQIQSRGTWAGNIANASPAADGVPVLMAYHATVVLSSTNGSRDVCLDAYYRGYKQTVARPDELITAIRIPVQHCDVQLFEKVGTRRALAITKIGVAVTHSNLGWRVVAISMNPVTCRCPSIEALLTRQLPVRRPEDLLSVIEADVSPIDDIRSTAVYRRTVMSRVLYFGLRDFAPAFS